MHHYRHTVIVAAAVAVDSPEAIRYAISFNDCHQMIIMVGGGRANTGFALERDYMNRDSRIKLEETYHIIG